MTRQFVVRLILAVSLLGTVAACGKSITAPESPKTPHDTVPWY